MNVASNRILNYEEYEEKTNLLKRYSHAYHTLDAPLVSDYEYDELFRLCREYEREHVELIIKDSPTQRIGDALLPTLKKSRHLMRMYSLDDVFNVEGLNAWNDRLTKKFDDIEYMCDVKFDGTSLNLLYEGGKLIKAATRGGGDVGEDVSHNVKFIQGIPSIIPLNFTLEIRGEVVIPTDKFKEINKRQEEMGGKIFANPRNLAAGSLRHLGGEHLKERNLMFIPWGFGHMDEQLSDKFSKTLAIIKELGFIDMNLSKVCKNINEVEQFYRHIISLKSSHTIMLDGLVVRIDDLKDQETLGYKSRTPRFAIAYKFPALQKSTKILNVEFNVGRSGAITPVAILEPIDLDGVTVRRATMHNFDEINRKDLRIGDRVLVIRSGDVIPKIIQVIKELRDGSEEIIIPPDICPTCGSTLIKEEVFIRCINKECKDRVIEGITYFASKKAMNIIGLGYKNIENFYNLGLLRSISDIYKITKDDLVNLDFWKDKKIDNLLTSIQDSKGITYDKFINALGIENIGEDASKSIYKLGKTLLDIKREDLASIDGFGDKMIGGLLDFIQDNFLFIKELEALINPVFHPVEHSETEIFDKQNIVLTGTMRNKRSDIENLLIKHGATIQAGVNKKTTLLIKADDLEETSSKLKKALDLEVKIMSESELFNLLNNINLQEE